MIIFFDMYLDMTRRDMYEKKNEHNNKKDEVKVLVKKKDEDYYSCLSLS